MKYIDILYGIATLSKIKVIDAYNTLPVTEGILRGKLKEKKNVVLCKRDYIDTDPVDGGWVKDPIVGMSTWTACYDFASLYPTTMRQFNISADSYKGYVDRDIVHSRKNQHMEQFKQYSDMEDAENEISTFRNHPNEISKEDLVLLNGSVFKNEMGVVSEVMGDIYGDRKSYKKKMFQSHNEMSDIQKKLDKLEEELLGGVLI